MLCIVHLNKLHDQDLRLEKLILTIWIECLSIYELFIKFWVLVSTIVGLLYNKVDINMIQKQTKRTLLAQWKLELPIIRCRTTQNSILELTLHWVGLGCYIHKLDTRLRCQCDSPSQYEQVKYYIISPCFLTLKMVAEEKVSRHDKMITDEKKPSLTYPPQTSQKCATHH